MQDFVHQRYVNVALQIGFSTLSFRVFFPKSLSFSTPLANATLGFATLRCLEKVPYIFSRINGGLMVMNPMGSHGIPIRKKSPQQNNSRKMVVSTRNLQTSRGLFSGATLVSGSVIGIFCWQQPPSHTTKQPMT